MYFDEMRDTSANAFAGFAVRGNGGDDGDDAMTVQQPRDVANTPNVLVAMCLRESEIATQLGPYLIPVDQLVIERDSFKPCGKRAGQGRFARAG